MAALRRCNHLSTRSTLVCPKAFQGNASPAWHRFAMQGKPDKLRDTYRINMSRSNLSQVELPTVTAQVAESPADYKAHAVVVGAGPAGALAAMFLAKRNYKVDVYEKRTLPPENVEERRRLHTYPMSITSRSLQGLQCVGADLPCAGPRAPVQQNSYGSPMLIPYPKDPIYNGYLVDRTNLGRDMVLEAQHLYPNHINFHFEHKLESINVEGCIASFIATNGDRVQQPYDLLVGADGANSIVRQQMMECVPEFSYKVLFDAQTTYNTFGGLPKVVNGKEVLPGISTHQPRDRLYQLRPKVKGAPFMVCWQGNDGLMHGMITQVKEYQAADLTEKLRAAFPDLPDAWLEEIVKQTCSEGRQPSKFGCIIQCNQFHGPRIVLLGDSASAVTSTLGQGCNMALESVHIFNEVLDATNDNLDIAPAQFTRQRQPDIRAFQHMEYWQVLAMGFPGIKAASGVEQLMAKIYFTLRMLFSMTLGKLLPSALGSFYVFIALRDPRIPFTKVKRTLELQAAMTGAMLFAAAVFVVKKMVPSLTALAFA